MICTHQSNLCEKIVAPPQKATAAIPRNGIHFHVSGVTLNICGNNNTCDHKATSNSHRHCFASFEMLPCVPAVIAMLNNNARNTAIAITVVIENAAIP